MPIKTPTLAYGMLSAARHPTIRTLKEQLERHMDEMRQIYEDRKKLPKHRNGRQLPRDHRDT